MPFMLNCTNRGCGKYQTPSLNINDNNVYCNECGKVIDGVSPFTKNVMKSSGQTIKSQKQAYSVKCEKCKQETLPILEANQLVCPSCKNLHKHISAPFAHLIKTAIAKGKEEL